MRRLPLLALAVAVLAGLPAAAQNSRDAERRLRETKRELQSVAAERRRLEGQRGDVSRQLQDADAKVARSARALRALAAQIQQEQQQLERLQQRRAGLAGTLQARRDELARLLRASDAQREAAPLKALLAQDRVADAQRALAYQRYLQRDRQRRVEALAAEMREIEALEAGIVDRRERLAELQADQRARLAQLERERRQRAELMATLDRRYEERRKREQALGRDVKGLQDLLARLRKAAVRAAAERRAQANAPKQPKPARSNASAPQVGGAGWPVSGALLAGYRATMPDGRTSDGLLIAAPEGAEVKAVADGTVVHAAWMTGYGQLAIVDHGRGYMSLYAHNAALLRSAGTPVKRGEAIARIGDSGGYGRPALYFELRLNGRPVNPSVWLKR